VLNYKPEVHAGTGSNKTFSKDFKILTNPKAEEEKEDEDQDEDEEDDEEEEEKEE
jgi:hypothetical protein